MQFKYLHINAYITLDLFITHTNGNLVVVFHRHLSVCLSDCLFFPHNISATNAASIANHDRNLPGNQFILE